MMKTKSYMKEVKAQQMPRERKLFVSQPLCLERTEEEVVPEECLTARDPVSVKPALKSKT